MGGHGCECQRGPGQQQGVGRGCIQPAAGTSEGHPALLASSARMGAAAGQRPVPLAQVPCCKAIELAVPLLQPPVAQAAPEALELPDRLRAAAGGTEEGPVDVDEACAVVVAAWEAQRVADAGHLEVRACLTGSDAPQHRVAMLGHVKGQRQGGGLREACKRVGTMPAAASCKPPPPRRPVTLFLPCTRRPTWHAPSHRQLGRASPAPFHPGYDLRMTYSRLSKRCAATRACRRDRVPQRRQSRQAPGLLFRVAV
jgi:hypothetical protein